MCKKEKCSECTFKKCCQGIRNIPIKRYFLPLLLVWGLLVFPEVRDIVYLPLLVFFGSFILFWNFPLVIYCTNSKPVYFEDLFIDKTKIPRYEIAKHIKNKFERLFKWTLIISNALLLSALSEYWLYKITDMSNYMEVLGISGGVFKIFQLINIIIGKLLIFTMEKCILREKSRYNKRIKNKIKEGIVMRKKIIELCKKEKKRKQKLKEDNEYDFGDFEILSDTEDYDDSIINPTYVNMFDGNSSNLENEV